MGNIELRNSKQHEKANLVKTGDAKPTGLQSYDQGGRVAEEILGIILNSFATERVFL